ncbi:hypothetical protein [Bosea sp. (in: a-proteobacteria)]|uniref:hypothetical protein n=1 Tax=Bosea sp. (in: a-proteobacteria) TaxID=1871050 RepID=UPI002B487991|nr:hypothetical protein [Bosea sp. (in: a-proteobacteria)]WRH58322.1 MAG: hypothetical protein RSE11_00590 [Bosea sp. (in: a-proteobacteria)]
MTVAKRRRARDRPDSFRTIHFPAPRSFRDLAGFATRQCAKSPYGFLGLSPGVMAIGSAIRDVPRWGFQRGLADHRTL